MTTCKKKKIIGILQLLMTFEGEKLVCFVSFYPSQVEKDLAYLREGSKNFEDYVFAVTWAQKFARIKRNIMMSNVLRAAHECADMPSFDVDPSSKAVNCHHNYVKVEKHFGKEVFLTRKGAVSKL